MPDRADHLRLRDSSRGSLSSRHRVGWWNDEGASGPARIVVHIGEQKAYFYRGKTLVGESTVSTGKPGFSTPPGSYSVLSKSPDHVSTIFGDYIDDYGNVVRSNIDARKDRRPPGTHFDGAEMPYAMFFRGGYAMHQGYVPPFAASHGCIRLPKGMASNIFRERPRRHTSKGHRVAQTSEGLSASNAFGVMPTAPKVGSN